MRTTTRRIATIGLCGTMLLATGSGAAPVVRHQAQPKTTTTATRKGGATPKKVAVALPDSTAARDSTTANDGSKPAAQKDGDYTMPGGQEGTVFRSLTVEGEDRVHFEFERPELAPDLDPAHAPGLDPGNPADVLLRSGPDLTTPFTALSAQEPCAWVARPWLSHFSSGAVTRFRPAVTDVARWKLMVADAHGENVATMEGKGTPPQEIVWDGREKDGSTVTPELTYSYVFEAHDRAGNKRNIVGEGFKVSAYRMAGNDGPTLVFSARDLAWPEVEAAASSARRATPPILLEAASWMNQAARPERPVRVLVTARSYDQGETIASNVVRLLTPRLVGDPARVKSQTLVQPDAPEAGTVTIRYAAN